MILKLQLYFDLWHYIISSFRITIYPVYQYTYHHIQDIYTYTYTHIHTSTSNKHMMYTSCLHSLQCDGIYALLWFISSFLVSFYSLYSIDRLFLTSVLPNKHCKEALNAIKARGGIFTKCFMAHTFVHGNFQQRTQGPDLQRSRSKLFQLKFISCSFISWWWLVW